MEAARDDIVARLVQVFDGRVTLGHFVNLWVSSVVEGGSSCRTMSLIRGWFLRGLTNLSCRCIETGLLEDLALHFCVFLSHFKPVIETLSIQDSLSVFCKFIAQK